MAHNAPPYLYTGAPVFLDEYELRFPQPVGRYDDRMWALCRQIFGCGCTMEFLSEGRHNTIYRLKLSSRRPNHAPRTAVFRLAGQYKHSSCINVKSEVETMLYFGERPQLGVPVPRVYAYSYDPNLMGGSFIVMEEITQGVDLATAFDSFTPALQQRVVEEYARLVFKLSQIRFSQIGSLERDPQIPGEYRLVALSTGKSNAQSRQSLPTHAMTSRPYRSSRDWLETTERENKLFLEYFPNLWTKREDTPERTREKHELANRAFEGMLRLIPLVAQTGGISGIFCLWHTDLHGKNILVCPSGPNAGQIVSVIDWESSGTYPIWRLPDPPEWFFYNSQRAARPQQEVVRHVQTFQTELGRRDHDGMLRIAMQRRYDFLRKVAGAATAPWQHWEMREQCMREWEREQQWREQLEQPKNTAGNRLPPSGGAVGQPPVPPVPASGGRTQPASSSRQQPAASSSRHQPQPAASSSRQQPPAQPVAAAASSSRPSGSSRQSGSRAEGAGSGGFGGGYTTDAAVNVRSRGKGLFRR